MSALVGTRHNPVIKELYTRLVAGKRKASVMLKQQLCRSGCIHGAESTGRQGTGKGVGASRLTSQACSFYVGVSATVRAVGPSGGTDVDVRLGLKGC